MAERKPVRRAYLRTFARRIEEAQDEFMKAWREQAKRPDRIGEYSYQWMRFVHSGVRLTIRELMRLEHATQPPHRTAAHRPVAPVEEAKEPARRPAATRRRAPAPTRQQAQKAS